MKVSPTPTKSVSRSPFHRAALLRLQTLLLLPDGVTIQCRLLLVRGGLTVDGDVIGDDENDAFIADNDGEDDEDDGDAVGIA